MALFHTTVLDNQIKALSTIGTAQGSIATFDTDRAERLVNLEVAITATGGGGTPDNPIAINGFSACNLSVNGTTETIPFGQTVYGGRLNVESGVLTVTWAELDLGSFIWLYANNTFYINSTPFPLNYQSYYCQHKCAIYKDVYVPTSAEMNNFECRIFSGRLYVKDSRYTDAPTYQTNISGTKLIYELATPTTIQLDSKQIQAIIGTNNIYADTGDIIDLKFVLTVGKAIS